MSNFFNSFGCVVLPYNERKSLIALIAVGSRKDSRAPRAPKRSPTPTSATYPDGSNLSPVPPSPGAAVQKPLYLCSPFVEAALVKGNFKTIVMLPKYVDVMEWVAVNSEHRV